MVSCAKVLLVAPLWCSSCGGQVGFDSTDGNPATGGSSSSSMQNTASSSSGGTSPSTGGTEGTGGSSTVDMAYCDGIFTGYNCGHYYADTSDGVTTCTVPLQSSPTDPYRTAVAIDCKLLAFAGVGQPDGGVVNGYLIDYSTDPATLHLVGSACDALQEPGFHTLELVVGCTTFN